MPASYLATLLISRVHNEEYISQGGVGIVLPKLDHSFVHHLGNQSPGIAKIPCAKSRYSHRPPASVVGLQQQGVQCVNQRLLTRHSHLHDEDTRNLDGHSQLFWYTYLFPRVLTPVRQNAVIDLFHTLHVTTLCNSYVTQLYSIWVLLFALSLNGWACLDIKKQCMYFPLI